MCQMDIVAYHLRSTMRVKSIDLRAEITSILRYYISMNSMMAIDLDTRYIALVMVFKISTS